MNDADAILRSITQLKHLGYTDERISAVIAGYSGYPDWLGFSLHQRRRLAEDLSRHARIAQKWYLATGG